MKNKIFYALVIFSLSAWGFIQAQDQGQGQDQEVPPEGYQQEEQFPPPEYIPTAELPPEANQETLLPPEAALSMPEQPPVQATGPAPSQISVSEVGGQNKISLDIKGMDVVDVLKMLATRAGLNIAVGRNVTGRVTLFLKDMDVWDAFEIILLANDLAYEKKGDIINVMTQRDYELQYGERYKDKKEAKVIPLKYAKAADLSRALNQIKSNIGRIVVDEASNILVLIDTPEKILEMEGFIQKADLVLKTQIFGLDYAQAEKIQPKIQEAVTKGVGSVKIDERTNKIVVTDYPEKIEEIGKIISAFDEKTPQVLIDAQIIEVSPTDNLQMGIDWDYWIKNHFRTTIPFGLTSVIGGIGASMAQNVTSVGDLSAVLSLLRTIGDTKVLSSPRIITLNNQEAKILVGKKDPYVTVTTTQPANGPAVISQNVQTVEWGIKLSVTPTINRDGFITMKIKPEVSTAVDKTVTSGNQTTILPVVSTTEAETTVMVKDGVTIIIGGLKSEKITKNYSEVPILGDIPIIGRLFRKTTNDKIETSDLVILLTPHIITGESAFADFSDIKPKDGYVARMEKGKVVKDKFSTNKQEQSIESIADRRQGKDSEYCRLIISKINHFAQQNAFVGKRGEVSVNFTLSPEGNLIKEPNVVEASEDYLAVLAVGAVKDAAPFPAFPADFEKADKSFQITLEYR